MGRRVTGIYPGGEATWQSTSGTTGTRLFRRGFANFEEAEKRLIRRLEQLRAVEVHGKRPERSFSEAAAHYLLKFQDKPSIVSETYHLRSVMPPSAICPSTKFTMAPWRRTWRSA